MVGHGSGAILRQLQSLLGAGTFSGLSDRELLDRFLERRDGVADLAFAVLIERHGPMVLGLCRRIMGDPHDAEDAFQATFLVLARRARSIRVEGSVGGWLFGVATRVATRARSDERRRRARERTGLDRLDPAGPDSVVADLDRAEVQGTIAREIAGLPARFQAPVLLCDLEGMSYEEAARRLGWPLGTVKSRLSRARARLRRRLTGLGLVPAEVSIGSSLLPSAPSPGLVAATTRTALILISGRLTTTGGVTASVATLTHGVLRTMTLTRINLAAGALLMVAMGSAVLLGPASAQRAGGRAVTSAPTTAEAGADLPSSSEDRVDVEMLERAWAAAIPRRDAAVIGRILADDFEGIDPVGNIFTKATYIPDLKGGVFAAAPIELDQVKTRLFGDAAVVTSRVRVKSWPSHGRLTNVYAKRTGRWQCVASHMSWATGAVCPGIGPITAEGRRLDPARETQGFSRRFDTNMSSCVACHSENPQGAIQPLRAPVTAQPPGDTKAEPARALPVAIDAAGQVTIGGEIVAADARALEERFRIAWAHSNRAEIVVSAAVETPFHLVKSITDAAQKVGFHVIRFDRLPDQAGASPATGALRLYTRVVERDDPPVVVRAPLAGRVERVHVKVGQSVKRGDALVELFSPELATAKGEYQMAVSQWGRDKKVYDYKKPLADANTLPRKELVDVENDEAQSRLKMKLAKDKLLIYGLTEQEIEHAAKEDGMEKARLTLRSPVDGVVFSVGAVPGSDYTGSDRLMRISPAPAQGESGLGR